MIFSFSRRLHSQLEKAALSRIKGQASLYSVSLIHAIGVCFLGSIKSRLEGRHEKTSILHMRKQRRRSASR